MTRFEGFRHGHRWGPWMLDAERICLCLVGDRVESVSMEHDYEVDIEGALSAGELLSWLGHIAGKTWPEAVEAAGYLALAFEEIFGIGGADRWGRKCAATDAALPSVGDSV